MAARKVAKRITARIERDRDGSWLVNFPAVPGAHTYGRSLSQLRRRIPEVLRLWDVDPAVVQIVEEIELPPRFRTAIERAAQERADLQQETDRLQRDLERTAEQLQKELGLGVRDTGELLGLSYQRVHQLRQRQSTASSRARRGRRAG